MGRVSAGSCELKVCLCCSALVTHLLNAVIHFCPHEIATGHRRDTACKFLCVCADSWGRLVQQGCGNGVNLCLQHTAWMSITRKGDKRRNTVARLSD